MKNVTCRKLPIDRIKAAQKLGTLKDISLFGSFEFPSSGSLSGIGKELQKETTAAQKYSQSCTSYCRGHWCRYIWRNSCPSRNTRYKTKSKSWGVQCPFSSTWVGAIKEIRFFWDCRHWRNRGEGSWALNRPSASFSCSTYIWKDWIKEYGRKHNRGFFQSQGDNFLYVVIRTPLRERFQSRTHLSHDTWTKWFKFSTFGLLFLSILSQKILWVYRLFVLPNGICISRKQINCQSIESLLRTTLSQHKNALSKCSTTLFPRVNVD